MQIGRAFTEYFLSESIPGTGEYLAKALDCPAPYSNIDYWFAVTLLNVLVHPDAEYLPFMKGKPWTPFYDAIRAGIRGDCAESATAVDSVNKLGVSQATFTCGIYLSQCYYHAARYSDALAALTRALAERSMYVTASYPKAVLLLGKIQEEMGNKKDALATYQKFLTLWKRADADLPALVDARKRVAKLRAVASN
jgi:tetratricopeptide (TPR) repeat protein